MLYEACKIEAFSPFLLHAGVSPTQEELDTETKINMTIFSKQTGTYLKYTNEHWVNSCLYYIRFFTIFYFLNFMASCNFSTYIFFTIHIRASLIKMKIYCSKWNGGISKI